MSPLSRLPAYFVFGQQHLDIQECAERIAQCSADKASTSTNAALLIFLDQVLLHAVHDVQNQIHAIQKVWQQACACTSLLTNTNWHCSPIFGLSF